MKKTKSKAAKPAKNKAKPAKKAGKPAAKPSVAAKKAAAPKAAKAAKGKPAAKAAGKASAGKLAAKAGKNGKAPAAAAAAKKPARVRVRICKAENCENPQTTQGFCRLHYLSKWKEIREEKLKRAQKNLDRYVERMAGAKKPAATGEDGEETEGGQKEEAVFEEDFGEFVDVLSREENLDKILNGIKVEDY